MESFPGENVLVLGGSWGNVRLDPAVRRALPKGCRVRYIENDGLSTWAIIGRINVSLHDDTPESFFIKVASHELGRNRTRSEFHSLRALHEVIPESVPKPIACGTYSTNPDTHFFLCEFHDNEDVEFDAEEFVALLSRLHQKSVSPTGQFGFHITTYGKSLPQFVGWEDSWETFFTKSLRQALDLMIQRNGSSEEIDVLSDAIFQRVIPRLLGPLESEGRTVKPSLIHGDLWYRNAVIDTNSNELLVFDACCVFAHNEYELGGWRSDRDRNLDTIRFQRPCKSLLASYRLGSLGAKYIAAYKKYVPISAPEEDFEGRLDLYGLRFVIHKSARSSNEADRPRILDAMRDLVRRYGQ